MSKKQEFINYVNEELFSKKASDEVPEEVRMFWEALCEGDDTEKIQFTDNGKLILTYMIEHSDIKMWKAKDLAEGLAISSRQASGAMRKLVTDEYVEKLGEDPVIYALTDKGRNVVFD